MRSLADMAQVIGAGPDEKGEAAAHRNRGILDQLRFAPLARLARQTGQGRPERPEQHGPVGLADPAAIGPQTAPQPQPVDGRAQPFLRKVKRRGDHGLQVLPIG